MNQYLNDDIAWLRVQDLQREAENRRLIAGGRPMTAMARRRRLCAARAAAQAATAERRHETA